MAPDLWVYAAIAAVMIVHLTALVWVRYRGATTFGVNGETARDAGAVPAPTDRASDVDGTSVPCPECGATNDPDFRYCWNCVADLPSAGVEAGRSHDGALI